MATNTNVDVQTSSTSILTKNDSRNYFALTNSGSNPVFIALGATAVADKGVYLAPQGGVYELNGMGNPNGLVTEEVNAIAVGGTSNLAVIAY